MMEVMTTLGSLVRREEMLPTHSSTDQLLGSREVGGKGGGLERGGDRLPCQYPCRRSMSVCLLVRLQTRDQAIFFLAV